MAAARRRGEEYLLQRRLFRRRSTGEVPAERWLQFSWPPRWHYDVLRALEYFRRTGDAPDERVAEAVQLVRDKQQPDGTWLLEGEHVWRHTRRGDKYDTVVIDLTAVREGNRPGTAAGDGRGPLQAGLQDMARRTG